MAQLPDWERMAEIRKAVAYGRTQQLQQKQDFLSQQTSYTRAGLIHLALKFKRSHTANWLLEALPPDYFHLVRLFSVAVYLENLDIAQLLWDTLRMPPQGLEIKAVAKFVRMGGNTQPVQIMLNQT